MYGRILARLRASELRDSHFSYPAVVSHMQAVTSPEWSAGLADTSASVYVCVGGEFGCPIA